MYAKIRIISFTCILFVSFFYPKHEIISKVNIIYKGECDLQEVCSFKSHSPFYIVNPKAVMR